MMATVITYITARTIEKKTYTSATGKTGWDRKGENKVLLTDFWERIKELCSREFILALLTMVFSALL